MCEELNEELSEGKKLAVKLVEHLCSMGAGKAMMPVFMDGIEYLVTIETVGPTNKADTRVKL